MGKNMYIRHVNDETDEFDGLGHIHPSCMWGFGFVHTIDYHHWHFNLKRMLFQKINPRKQSKGKRRAKELDHDVGERQNLLNEDEKCFSSVKESGLNHKRSLKARIKSLIAEETSKEGNCKQRGSSVSPQSKLQRTYSIHHLEPKNHGLGEVCSDWEHPIIFFPNNKDTSATKLWDAKNLNVTGKPDGHGKKSKEVKNKDASKDKLKQPADGLEIFKVNKDLFLEIVQDTDGGLRKFSHTLPGLNAKARLTKSGSYPTAHLLQKRDLEPSTLKQKQCEIWSAPKGEKLNTVSVMPKVEKFKYSKHSRSKSLPFEYSSRGSKLGQALDFNSEATTESAERNSEVLKPFKERKHSVQYEVTEGGNEVSNGDDCSMVENNSAKRCGESATCRVDKSNSFSSHETEEQHFSRSTRSHRRSSSLNESLDKYTRLFGNDLGKDVNLHSSRSLKLRNEYEMGLVGNAPLLLGRICSLSHLESYSSIQNEMHGVDNLEELPITTVEENSSYSNDSCQDELKSVGSSPSTEGVVSAGDIQESTNKNEIRENVDNINQMADLAGTGEISATDCVAGIEEEADPLMVGKSNSFREQQSISSEIDSIEFAQPCSVPAVETYFEEVSSSDVEFQTAEGLENRCDNFDEDSSINCQKSIYVEPSSLSSSVPNLQNLDDMKDAELGGSNQKHETDLDYVKDILKYSGFAKDALQKSWHSSNQPLDPSVFYAMEAYWHKELESSGEDYTGCYHHQLLFDIVNEKLAYIYDRSFTYYPKAFSSCHIRPFPVGDHIVDEMSTTISILMSLKPEQKQSLECLVGMDMGKDDGWMNLQSGNECLALELEDMIFDEFLEELEDMIFEQVFGT